MQVLLPLASAVIARRSLLSVGLFLLLARLRGARGQTAMRRIGLIFYTTEAASAVYLSAFARGMRQLGWEEGRNITYRGVYPKGDLSRLESLASGLVEEHVDVIVVSTSPAVRAAQRVTSTVPIVFTPLSNVVGNGYVASLARPGGNVTGIASQFEDLLPKLLEFLHAIVPGARRIAVLVNEANLSHDAFWRAARDASASLDLLAYRVVANSSAQFGPALEQMVRLRVQAVLVSIDFLFLTQRVALHELLQAARLPAAYGFPEHVAVGGLLSYGPSLLTGYEQAATYVDKILRGAKPADLPVEQPTRFQLVINLKTAEALGLTVPQSVLLRADEFIR
jgi:putative ABC transport system substrate-binding protein